MTRAEIITGFHKLYLENIAKETAKRGSVGARKGGGIPMDALKKIHDDTIADLGEALFNRDPAAIAMMCGEYRDDSVLDALKR